MGFKSHMISLVQYRALLLQATTCLWHFLNCNLTSKAGVRRLGLVIYSHHEWKNVFLDVQVAARYSDRKISAIQCLSRTDSLKYRCHEKRSFVLRWDPNRSRKAFRRRAFSSNIRPCGDCINLNFILIASHTDGVFNSMMKAVESFH